MANQAMKTFQITYRGKTWDTMTANVQAVDVISAAKKWRKAMGGTYRDVIRVERMFGRTITS